MGRTRRAGCVVLGLLLTCVVACGRSATGAPLVADAPLEPAAAASTTAALAVPSDTAFPEAVADAPPDGSVGATALPPAPGAAAPGAAAPGAAAPGPGGPAPAAAPARAGEPPSGRSGPGPGTTRAAAGTAPGVGPPAVAPPPAPTRAVEPPTPQVVAPTRTPAPLLIAPIDAYSGPLDAFEDAIDFTCTFAEAKGCLRVVPRTLPGQSQPITNRCIVVSSEPDLHKDADDPDKKIAIPRDEIPKTLDTVVNCASGSDSDTT